MDVLGWSAGSQWGAIAGGHSVVGRMKPGDSRADPEVILVAVGTLMTSPPTTVIYWCGSTTQPAVSDQTGRSLQNLGREKDLESQQQASARV